MVETFVWWLFPIDFHILSPDKFSSRVSFTMGLIRVKIPSRISSTSDLVSVQQQIPGGDSIASPAEQSVLSSRSRYVSSVVRKECLIDAFLSGGCSPHNFTSPPNKIPSIVIL